MAFTSLFLYSTQDEITPHKFSSYEEIRRCQYDIPPSCRFATPRPESNAPDIVYYVSKPKVSFRCPIAILIGGSTSRDAIGSIVHVHRYFLQEFLSLPCAIITVEQWGVDGNRIDETLFLKHYTRSQRLKDHRVVIENLLSNPPAWWNGKFILVGVSEGGPLVTKLTEYYAEHVAATVNWCGSGDYSWLVELWEFIGDMRKNAPWWMRLWDRMPSWMPFSFGIPKSFDAYSSLMQQISQDPTSEKFFMGMTYLYHADALAWPENEYAKLTKPFLVVAGTRDSIIDSCDSFVEKAKAAGADTTYMRVEGMDHYIRLRPDIIEQSFVWLKERIKLS